MIEVIYSGETKKPKTQAEETLAALKNIRQIGNAVGNTRIYVEDCVMSFLNRQMQKSDPGLAALLGKESNMDGVTYLFVNGALLPEGITVRGEALEFAPQAFPKLYEDAERYFPENTLLGWYLPAYDMIGKYGATLGQNCRLFLLEDPTESEEIFYLWEQNRLIKQNGYYIYYQRNEEMKQYMQNCREKNGEEKVVRKTWTEESRQSAKSGAEKDEQEEFIDDYEENEKTELFFKTPQSRFTTFLYGVSTVLAIVVLVIGITLINNYEKMYEMQEAIETIATSLTGDKTPADGENAKDLTEDNGQKPSETSGGNEGSVGTTGGAAGSGTDADAGTTGSSTDDGTGAGSPDNRVGNVAGTGAGTSLPGESGNRGTNGAESGSGETADALTAGGIGSAVSGSMTGQLYTIQPGDTLAGICRKLYQNTDKIDEILQLNQGLDANELIVGEKIILP